MHQRFDAGTLGKAEKTPQGGLRVPAFLTKSGLFEYRKPDGTKRIEYRSPDEVFKADSLATLDDAPLTVDHPGLLSPDNHAQHAVGHVRDVKQDGERVAAQVIVQGRKAIKAIENGTRQLSCGYVCDTDETPGTTPDGKHYDAVQHSIRYNHVALVDAGRAGPDVRLRLDAAGNQTTHSEVSMKVERIDGVEYEIDSAPHKAACERRDMAVKAAKDAGDVQRARLDSLEVENKKLKADIAELPAKLAEQVKVRSGLESRARVVVGSDVKLDGLSDVEVRKLTLKKASPELKLDGESDAYIAAAFDLALLGKIGSDERADAAAHAALRESLVPGKHSFNSGDALQDLFDTIREDQRDAWMQPLSITREEA